MKTRVTGANNWSTAATWIQVLTGTVTFTSGSRTVTGAGTAFTTEVAVGDVLMLDATPATVRGTVASITSNTSLQLVANAGANVSGAYGVQSVPAPGDDVEIGNTRLGTAAAITLDTSATVNSLTLIADNLAHTLTHSGANSLTVTTAVTINQPTANNRTIAWNINAGSASVLGSVVLGGANNTASRVSQIAITSGTLTILGDLTFTTGNSAAVASLDLSGGTGGTVNLAGALSTSSNRGTLTAGTSSTFNFNGTAAGQTIPIGVSAIVYNTLATNNTSAAGATLSAAITATNVTGDLSVQSGALNNGGFAVTLASGKSLSVASNATLNLTGTSTMAVVSGGGTKSFGATSTVNYAGAGQTVTAEAAPGYGHLTLSGSGTKTMPASALFTQGNFTTSGTVTATAAAAMTVGGNFTIGAGTTFSAASFSHAVNGDFTRSGTFNANTSTFNFTGSTSTTQTISGTPTFNNLTINATGSGGVTLGSNVSTTGLALTSGIVTTGANTLTSLTNCDNVTRSSGWVAGFLSMRVPTGSRSCTFHVGGATNYRPIALDLASVATAGSLTGSVTQSDGEHGSIAASEIDAAHDVNRYWTLTNSGVALTSYDATFTFAAADVDTNASPATFQLARWDGTAWSYPSLGARTATTIKVTGLTSFSNFVAGQRRVRSFVISVPASQPVATCAAQPIGIAARDSSNQTITNYVGLVSISTSTAHGTWSVSSANGTLTDSTPDDGAATYQFVSSDLGVVSLLLTNNHGDSLTITVADGATGTSSISASLVFSGNTFTVTSDTIQVAGRNQSMTVSMNGSASCASPLSAYTGSKNLKAWYTRDASDPGGTAPTIVGMSGAPLGTSAPAASNLALTFTNGSATFSLSTVDVGKYVINLRDDSGTFSGTPGAPVQIDGSSPTITTRPFGIALTGIQHGSTAASAVFAKAGAGFSTTVGAYLWQAADDANDDGVPDAGANITNNGLTPAFAWPVALSVSAALPSPGTTGTITFSDGSAANVTQAAFSGGAATISLKYSEVGQVLVAASASNYLNSGVTVSGDSGKDGDPGGGYIGRFYPDHFTLTSTGAATQACSAGAFSYLGQSASLSTVKLEARNADDAKTANYAGTYAKLDPTSFAAFGFGARDTGGAGTNLGSRLTGTTSSALGWSSGEVIFSASVSVDRAASPDGPYGATRIGIAPADSDGVSLQAAVYNIDTDGAGGSDHAQIGADTKWRFGRLALQNAHGSQALDLVVPVELQYWNGSTWVRNTDDSCTTLVPGNFVFGNHTGQLTSANYSAGGNVSVGSFSSGSGSITLTKPAAGRQGSVDVTLNLGTLASAATCSAFAPNSNATAASLAHLRGQWCAGGYTKDPVAKATFGIYRNRFVFRREVY